jgi:hypothetical protein
MTDNHTHNHKLSHALGPDHFTTALRLDPALSISALRQWDIANIDPSIPARRHEIFGKLGVSETPPGN